MSAAQKKPDELLPLTPAVFHVLLALADGERHGYAVMQEVAEHTEGAIKMGPGTLYGTVKRLLKARLIEESDERPDSNLDDERRRYYRLTALGEQVVKAEARRYEEMVRLARGKRLIGKLADGLYGGGS
jgi:DNA-binding PadR family transcriptional regulator